MTAPRAYSSRRGARRDEVSPVKKSDPDVEGFLALAAARLAPRTVEAYRRDLASLTEFLGGSPADASTMSTPSPNAAHPLPRKVRLHARATK